LQAQNPEFKVQTQHKIKDKKKKGIMNIGCLIRKVDLLITVVEASS
jgi:hypothetical protein